MKRLEIAEQTRPWEVFGMYFNGRPNIITPTILSRDVFEVTPRLRYYYELSKGRGITGDTLYGLTVLRAKNYGEKDIWVVENSDLSACSHNKEELLKTFFEKVRAEKIFCEIYNVETMPVII